MCNCVSATDGTWVRTWPGWSILAALLCALSTAATAKRSAFVRDIVVVASDTPPPAGDEKWREVPERRKLASVIQHPVPSWRNLWLPVRHDDTYLAADTLSIAEFFRNRGYLDAYIESVSLEPVGGESEMQFVDVVIVVAGIEETGRYSLAAVRFDGVRALDSTKVREQFEKGYGQERYFSPAAAEENLISLKTAYADAGYLDSTAVQIGQRVEVNRERRTVTVRYSVTEREPYRVCGFRIINGNAPEPLRTDSGAILESVVDAKLGQGAIFGRQRILDAEGNLADLGVFRRARVTPEACGNDSAFRRRAAIDVAERDAWDIRTRAGFSSIEGLRASERVTFSNFRGEAKVLGQDGQASRGKQTVSLFYSQPRIGLPRVIPGVGGRSLNVRMDQVLTSEWEITDTSPRDTTRTLQWKVAVSRRFGPLARLGVSYDFSRKDLSLGHPFGVGRRVIYQGAVTLSGAYDSRDDFLNATRGLALTAQVKLTNLARGPGRMNVRPEALVQYYHEVLRRVVAAYSISSGFYLVGERGTFDVLSLFWRSAQTPTVRGYRRDDITAGIPRPSIIVSAGGTGGTATLDTIPRTEAAMAYLLGKAELRANVWKRFGLVLFLDAAEAWPRRPGVGDDQLRGWSAMQAGRFAVSAGLGPRINWAVPIRIDIARTLRAPGAWRFEFGIGQAF